MAWEKLDYQDGDFILVRSPSLHRFTIVKQYHLELSRALEGLPIYPIEESVETQIYNNFRFYYQKIASLLEPEAVECDRLLPLSRHEFFVCTEPVTHPTANKTVPGLSKLSTLMGYSYTNVAPDESEASKTTTGDNCLDLYVDLALVFKSGARQMAIDFSPEDVSKMLVQANSRLQQATEDLEAGQSKAAEQSQVAEPVESEEFVAAKDEVGAAIASMDIELPQGW